MLYMRLACKAVYSPNNLLTRFSTLSFSGL